MELQSRHADSFELDKLIDCVLQLDQQNSRSNEIGCEVDQLRLTNLTAVINIVFCSWLASK